MTNMFIADDPHPDITVVVKTISKVCDLPDREEKWAVLKVLTEILILEVYPPMMIGRSQQ